MENNVDARIKLGEIVCGFSDVYQDVRV